MKKIDKTPEQVEEYISGLGWSDDVPDVWKTITAGNIRTFYVWLTRQNPKALDSKKFWVVNYAPLRDSPGGRIMLTPMLTGSIVEATGNESRIKYNSLDTLWVEVLYVNSVRAYRGWVYSEFLEQYSEEFPGDVVSIQSPTIDPTDAAQYMVIRGQKQYNLCGELCVCYIYEEDIEVFLEYWEAKEISIFRRIFGSGKARGTTAEELKSMLSVYGPDLSMNLDKGLWEPVLNRPLVTPGRMAKMLETHRAIVSVHIDGATGNLRGGGILHWVVLDQVIPDGAGRGWVELYNPFNNRVQRYSYDELIKSMGGLYGVWTKR